MWGFDSHVGFLHNIDNPAYYTEMFLITNQRSGKTQNRNFCGSTAFGFKWRRIANSHKAGKKWPSN